MCDDFIHQGLTHDPTVSRRAFGLGAAATVVLHSTVATAQTKVVEKDVNVTMESGVSDSALFYPEGKGPWPGCVGVDRHSWAQAGVSRDGPEAGRRGVRGAGAQSVLSEREGAGGGWLV